MPDLSFLPHVNASLNGLAAIHCSPRAGISPAAFRLAESESLTRPLRGASCKDPIHGTLLRSSDTAVPSSIRRTRSTAKNSNDADPTIAARSGSTSRSIRSTWTETDRPLDDNAVPQL